MPLRFEWDAEKARTNSQKHGIPFEEAATVFADPLSLTVDDPLHSETEQRFITVGMSAAGRVVVVVHADRGDTIRLISARLATGRERRSYEET
jgi:uncharacterized DUF497 family protein